jgi:outer membrane receptor protein involved in Fe transport
MKRIICSILLGFCATVLSLAQTGSLEGKVTDQTSSEPLIAAAIVVKGTTNGTITDLDGNYTISGLEPGTYVFKASFIGYSPVEQEIEILADETTQYDFALAQDLIGLDEVVITGVVNPRSALESSVAMTTMNPKSVKALSATTTAEIFKAIPGIHSESSGGEGNANISVRGVPISTGGAKFLQLYEDGLPVLQFGDIMFGNADIFVRADNTVGRIEAIRGGSASTFASNSPAGIINFISKTGVQKGGSIGTTFGVDYKDFRTDFNFGAPIGDGLTFNIGGFYRQGVGPREVDYDGNIGGQIKANITKNFDNGYARIYFKHLNDRSISYMPMPVTATGTGLDPQYESIEGFDMRTAALQSSEFFRMSGIDENGNPRTTNISDGMHPVSNAIGAEFSFDLGDGWQLKEKGRLALTNGSFRTLFPMGPIGSADDIAQSVMGDAYAPGYTFSYANGANAGQALNASQLSGLNGNGLLMQVASFDVDINSLNNFTNDLYISKRFNNINLTLGYYKAYQQIAMYWDWQGYITDVSTMPRLMNIASADGSYYTESGVTNYGVWGLGRKYDMKYNIDAPYANFDIEVNKQLNVDASVRYDFGHASGYYLNGKTASVDVNSDGVLSPAESNATIVDNTKPNAVDYTYGYLSFSAGANYKIDDGNAFYARVSQGGRANADRLLYSPFLNDEGETIDGTEADMILQIEGGYKYKSPKLSYTITPYFTNVTEQNADPTEQKIYLIGFQSYGAELEASAKVGNLMINAGAIFTKAKITSSLDEANVGNTPRRVPDLMYHITPTYTLGKAVIGLNLIGTTKVFVSNSNEIVLPGYAYLNGFLSYGIAKNLNVNLNVNNITNVLGFTEAESHSFVDNSTNYMRARPITGRSTTMSISYNF